MKRFSWRRTRTSPPGAYEHRWEIEIYDGRDAIAHAHSIDAAERMVNALNEVTILADDGTAPQHVRARMREALRG